MARLWEEGWLAVGFAPFSRTALSVQLHFQAPGAFVRVSVCVWDVPLSWSWLSPLAVLSYTAEQAQRV